MALVIPGTTHIICTRNRPAFLSAAVDSVLSASWVPAELIVVDQSDRSHPALATQLHTSGCELRYLWHPDRGLSRARNAGARAASYDIISYTDDDILVTPGWYRHLVQVLEGAGPRAVATGQVVAQQEQAGSGFAPSVTSDEERLIHTGRTGRDVLSGALIAVHRLAFREVGMFDVRLGAGSHYPGAEDNDFGYRLLEAGYAIHFVPEVVVFHRAWRTDPDLVPMRWAYGRGQGAFMAKHFDLRDRYILKRYAIALYRHLRRLTYQVRMDHLQAIGNTVYCAGLLSGAAEWLLTQRRLRR